MERNKALWGMIFLMVMVLLPSISAFGETISINERLKTDLTISPSAMKYPAISVKGFWDFMPLVEDTKADLVLTKHDASCGIDCMSEFQIVTYQDSPLIEDIKFYRLDEGKTEERSIRSYQFQYWGDVTDYKTECSPAKLTEEEIKNETKPYDVCVQVESGKHKDFISYNMGDVLPAGTYDVKLLGQKAPYMSIDWVIKTQGKLIEEWATWGNISTGSQAEVVLNSPANNSIVYTNLVTTNYSLNVTNGATVVNTTGYIWYANGTFVTSNTSSLSTSYNVAGFTYTSGGTATAKSGLKFVMNGDYVIKNVTKPTAVTATKCYILDSSKNVLASGTFSGDVCPITYSLLSATTYYVAVDNNGANYAYRQLASVSYPAVRVPLNFTTGLDNTGADLGGYAFQIDNMSLLSGGSAFTVTFTNTLTAGQSYLYNGQGCDSDGACGFAPQNFTFSVDGTAPTVTLNYPTALINYGAINQTLQLNLTATDTNLASVWYNYNGTNVTITGATSGVANLSNITLNSKKNITIYANDTAGNLNTTTFSWDYTLFETSRTFNSSTFTTAEEPFTLNITTNGSQIPIAYLVYNGTSYLATRTGNLTNPMFSNSITMTNTGNMSFYWSILWGSQVINTSTSYQQVTAVTAMNITSSACSAGLTKVANFTFANEVNFTALTGATVNYNFKYGIANSTGLVSSGTLTNVSVFNVCLNLTQSANYTIGYGEVQYSNDGYSDRRFYLFENTRYSNNTITNVLYSLPNANSYSFLFEARTPALNVYSDKYVSLLRWYPSINDYKVVEMGKTDQKGQTVFKVKTEDVDYRIGIYERDGTLIYLANPIRMVCLVSPCSYTLTVRTTEGYSYDNRLQVQNSLTYNNGTFSFTYNDPSQATDLMRLVVYSMSGTDETQICEDNSTSFTAILSCDVSSTTGILKAVAYRTASPEFPLATLIIDTLTTIFQGTFGLFLQFLLTTTLILAGLISPVVAIILGILSLLIGVLVFKTISISIAIGIGILGAIVIHFIKRQGTI